MAHRQEMRRIGFSGVNHLRERRGALDHGFGSVEIPQDNLYHDSMLPALLLAALPLSAKIDFVRDVKPILETRCVRCHGDSGAMKNLRLDRRDRALRAIVPKKPDESVLYLSAKIGFMPPGPTKLSESELDTLRRWIAEGARWPKNVELQWSKP